ncbi:MAG: LacI family DNA-binding transcriptional regulator [Leptothrix sp. (in: b-proteobacteria)]
MSRPFLVKDIAQQAGVSVATVDRVLNRRPNVRVHMAQRVEQAIEQLQRQSRQVGAVGRKLMLDLVMETPQRFSSLVRRALDGAIVEMAALQPTTVLRARHELQEVWPPHELVALLDRIAARGSHGVLLKAPDLPEVVAAVDRLVAAGIPVVTLVTDLPLSRRLAYVGVDNRAAGETAAYLVGQWLGGARRAGVLVSLSSVRFRGEEEREIGFRQAMRRDHPRIAIHDVSEGRGVHERTVRLVRARLQQQPELAAVYSVGGANAAILDAFEQLGRRCRCFIGHDLDADNLALLRAGRIHALLHHDLRQDLRRACLQLMAAHGVSGLAEVPGLSNVDVITPFNLPQPWG